MMSDVDMAQATLSIALGDYGHTRALKQGEVSVPGARLQFVEAKPIIGAFRRMVREQAFDICEMAPATYLIARAAGAPFKALPIFVFRRFHHHGLLCREGSGIRAPRDLEGRRVGVRAYSVSTGLWTRGILQDEYGVDLSRVTWVVDDEEHVQGLRLPANVVHAPPGLSLVDLMVRGELDAAFGGNAGIGRAGAPTPGWQAASATPSLRTYELLADAAQQEADWYRRTGIYPVHGLVVVRDSVLARFPWLGRALFEAFDASRLSYLDALQRGHGGSDTDGHYQAMSELVGDPLPFGIEPNRRSLEALLRYCHVQGLLSRLPTVDEMFIDPMA